MYVQQLSNFIFCFVFQIQCILFSQKTCLVLFCLVTSAQKRTVTKKKLLTTILQLMLYKNTISITSIRNHIAKVAMCFSLELITSTAIAVVLSPLLSVVDNTTSNASACTGWSGKVTVVVVVCFFCTPAKETCMVAFTTYCAPSTVKTVLLRKTLKTGS